jgi:DNA repair exonuclease SbcCD ATPase subunit
MVIESTEICNFKGIRKIKADIEGIVALTGNNGAGKTSFLEAVRYAITGKAPSDMRNKKAPSGFVSVTIKDVGTVTRKWDEDKTCVFLNGKATTARSVAEHTAKSLGIAEDAPDILTSSGIMDANDAGELSEFLLNGGFLLPDLDADKVVGIAPIGEGAEREIRMQLPEAPEKVSLDMLDALHKEMFDTRKFIKRQAAELKAKADYKGPMPKRPAEEVEAEISTLTEKRGAAAAEKENYEKMLALYEKSAKAIVEAKEKASAIKVTSSGKKDIEKNEEDMKETEASLADVQKRIGTLDNMTRTVRKTLADLASPVCPISEKLVCKTDKSAVSRDLEKACAESEELLEKAREDSARLEKAQDGLKNERKRLLAEEELYNKRLHYAEQAESLEKSAPKKPDAKKTADLSVTDRRLEELREEHREAVMYAEAEAAGKKSADLLRKIEIYDEAVRFLDPKSGVRKAILDRATGTLEEYMSESAGRIFEGRSVKLDTSKGFTAGLVTDGSFVPYASLSSGEKIKLTVIIADALNFLSGYGVLMIDRVSELDDEAADELFGLLSDEEFVGKFGNIFVAGVGRNAETALGIKGIKEVKL